MRRLGLRSERGQALPLLVAGVAILMLGTLFLGSWGRGLVAASDGQGAVDAAALSAARVMQTTYPRVFIPPEAPGHVEKAEYLARARAAAVDYASRNGLPRERVSVTFPDSASVAPLRVAVTVRAGADLGRLGGEPAESRARISARSEAEVHALASGGAAPAFASGGGYNGPLAYRQGKPMRPDVAMAFDRLFAAARAQGVHLVIGSGYRSDAEQAVIWARHPDPKWVAPPGRSLHRMGTELDLGPPSAYGWLAANAGRFGFIKRYSWEPWHFGYAVNIRSTPDHQRQASGGDGRSRVPSFVPAQYVRAITDASMRWSVSAALLSAQIYAESNFNPFARSPAGAQGIAQFIPSTARRYGLSDPFDADAAIDAQAHMMRDLLRRFGSVPLALAAYNAGPGAVERYGGIPPYPETRAYVARILALMGGAGDQAFPAMEIRLVG